MIKIIHGRLRKDRSACLLKDFLRDILHIVTDEHSDTPGSDSEIILQFLVQLFRLYRKGLLLFHIDTSDVSHLAPPSMIVALFHFHAQRFQYERNLTVDRLGCHADGLR